MTQEQAMAAQLFLERGIEQRRRVDLLADAEKAVDLARASLHLATTKAADAHVALEKALRTP